MFGLGERLGNLFSGKGFRTNSELIVDDLRNKKKRLEDELGPPSSPSINISTSYPQNNIPSSKPASLSSLPTLSIPGQDQSNKLLDIKPQSAQQNKPDIKSFSQPGFFGVMSPEVQNTALRNEGVRTPADVQKANKIFDDFRSEDRERAAERNIIGNYGMKGVGDVFAGLARLPQLGVRFQSWITDNTVGRALKNRGILPDNFSLGRDKSIQELDQTLGAPADWMDETLEREYGGNIDRATDRVLKEQLDRTGTMTGLSQDVINAATLANVVGQTADLMLPGVGLVRLPSRLSRGAGVVNPRGIRPEPARIPVRSDIPVNNLTPEELAIAVRNESPARNLIQEVGGDARTTADGIVPQQAPVTAPRTSTRMDDVRPGSPTSPATITRQELNAEINAVRNDPNLSAAEKNDIIRQLEESGGTQIPVRQQVAVKAADETPTVAKKDIKESQQGEPTITQQEVAKMKAAQEAEAVGVRSEQLDSMTPQDRQNTIAALQNQQVAPAAPRGSAGDLDSLVVQNIDEPVRGVFRDIVSQLSGPEAQVRANARSLSAQRGARSARAQKAYDEAGGGEAGQIAYKRALSGEYNKGGFDPIKVDREASDHFLKTIDDTDLMPFEKGSTREAFRKLWGTSDNERLLPSDIKYIKDHLNRLAAGSGDEVAEALTAAMKTKDGVKEVAAKLVGLPRALMATGDLSHIGRQAMPLGVANPKEYGAMVRDSVKYALNPEKYQAAMKAIEDSPSFNLKNDIMGIKLSGVRGVKDDAFMSSDYASKIPVANVVVDASERAYTGGLTKIRSDVADKFINKAGGPEAYVKKLQDRFGDKWEEAAEAMGDAINVMTGAGARKGGWVERNAEILNASFFSPQLMASNLKRLNPVWYANLARRNPEALALALRAQSGHLAAAATILGIGAAMGATVGLNPTSSDFGKLRVDNTRYDLWGGVQPYVVLAARLLTGQMTSTSTGESSNLGEGYGSDTKLDKLVDTFANKSNPVLNFLISNGLRTHIDSDTGKLVNQYGDEVDLGWELAKMGMPISVSGAIEDTEDSGSLTTAIVKNLPDLIGVGSNTFGPVATKDQPAKNEEVQSKIVPQSGSTRVRDALPEDIAGLYDKMLSDRAYEVTDKQASRVTSAIADMAKGPNKVTRFLENGDYDSHLNVLRNIRGLEEARKSTTKKELDRLDRTIRQAEILRDNNISAEDYELYNEISSTEFNAMINPKKDEYDPDMAERLWAIDQLFTEAEVNGRTSGANPWTRGKYSMKKETGGRARNQFAGLSGTTINWGDYLPKIQEYDTTSLMPSVQPPTVRAVNPRIVHKITNR